MQPNICTFTDDKGREFYYSLVENNSDKLVVHFTAFFGDWGDRKEYKENYKGYFHRYKMLANQQAFNVLFLCDHYGVTNNGTYYTGKAGDFFVERAVKKIILSTLKRLNISTDKVISIGSSMGATAAIKFGLIEKFKGIIAIAPHIDLDLCAKFQGREHHVAWICPDGDTQSPSNYVYTRQIRKLLSEASSQQLPRLFIHSCMDDKGVYDEQVVPFVNSYKNKGGQVDLFIKSFGGHGSDACGKEVLLDLIAKYFENKPVDVQLYNKSSYLTNIVKVFKKIIKIFVKKLNLLKLVNRRF